VVIFGQELEGGGGSLDRSEDKGRGGRGEERHRGMSLGDDFFTVHLLCSPHHFVKTMSFFKEHTLCSFVNNMHHVFL
jgi:hypothetical protein